MLQILSVICALLIMLLFPILHYVVLPLPTTYSPKTTQQLVNFLVVPFGICIGVFLKNCLEYVMRHDLFSTIHLIRYRRITNVAETTSNLRGSTLSLTRLQVHTNASKQSFWGILKVAWYDSAVRTRALFYLFTLGSFSGLTWALSVIFVINFGQANQAIINPRAITLSSDVPIVDDACTNSITSGNCTYDLAVSTLSSQLITHTPYTISSIQFVPPFGSRGLPYDVLNKFSGDVETSAFGGKLLRQYCLPVLNAKTVSCQQDVTNSRVNYSYETTAGGLNVYGVTINPNTKYANTHVRVSFQNGTMTVAQSQIPSELEVTIITATDVYADLLSQLTYGTNSTSEIFTLVCTINTQSSWQWVPLSFDSGVYQVQSTSGACESGYDSNVTGFTDLFYAIEGATRVVNAIDGYSKYINADITGNTVSPYGSVTQQKDQNYAAANNMTLLESILSQLYELVQTSYSATNLDVASTTNVFEARYRNAYVITVEWSAASILALVMSIIILISTTWQAFQYFEFTKQLVAQPGTDWELTEVVDLMGYSLTSARQFTNDLDTEARRKAARKGTTNILLQNA